MPRKIAKQQLSFNTLPLWQAARQQRYRQLPLAARRLVDRYGLEPESAALLCELANLGGRGQ